MVIKMYEVIERSLDELKIEKNLLLEKLEEQITNKNLYDQFGVHEAYLVEIGGKTYKVG